MQSFIIRGIAALLFTLPLAANAITDNELKEAAAAVNQQAPMMVDQETRLDGASSGKQSLTYNYTMVNYAVSDLDVDKFTQALRPSLLKAGCEVPKPLLSQGVDVNYVYRDKAEDDIAALKLTAADCGF